jgi:hypothetical protein
MASARLIMAQNGGDGYSMGYKNGTLMTLLGGLILAANKRKHPQISQITQISRRCIREICGICGRFLHEMLEILPT